MVPDHSAVGPLSRAKSSREPEAGTNASGNTMPTWSGVNAFSSKQQTARSASVRESNAPIAVERVAMLMNLLLIRDHHVHRSAIDDVGLVIHAVEQVIGNA